MQQWEQKDFHPFCGNNKVHTFAKGENQIVVSTSNYHDKAIVSSVNHNPVHLEFVYHSEQDLFSELDNILARPQVKESKVSEYTHCHLGVVENK